MTRLDAGAGEMFRFSVGDRKDLLRTIITGNSGSGKSWLARRLDDASAQHVTDLDDVHWLPGGHDERRNRAAAIELATAAARAQSWIVEGVFGWLVEPIVHRATLLIWLDFPWLDCDRNLRSRHEGETDTQSFRELVVWARGYWERQTPSSYAGHKSIYESFEKSKIRLTSRNEVDEFLRWIEQARDQENRRERWPRPAISGNRWREK